MSVSETYAIAVEGPRDGLAIAERLATSESATLRWAAAWTDARDRAEALAGARTPSFSADAGLYWVALPRPTRAEARQLVEAAAGDPVCVHWSANFYGSDEGPETPWIAFVDPLGRRRDDAKVYQVELAGHAVPLTTPVDRPDQPNFEYGPRPGEGWALHVGIVRDHMPRDALRRFLADAAGVPLDAVQNVV